MKPQVARIAWRFASFAVVVGLLWSGPTRAAIFTVNDTADAIDATPGNGVCETSAGNGVCTLRAAIQEANALGGSHTINLPAGTFVLSRVGVNEDNATTGDFDTRATLTITGAGRTDTIIDGNRIDRVFHVVSGLLSLNSMTVRNGRREGPLTDATVVGGAVYVQFGSLSLNNVIARDNFASLDGGALYTIDQTITVVNSVLENNSTEIGGRGGAIVVYSNNSSYGLGRLTLQDSTLKGNSSSSGGAIYCARAIVNITRLRAQFNTAPGNTFGGGAFNGYQCDVTVTQSTFDQNQANSRGGAFSLTSSTVTVTNSTFSGNGTGTLDGLSGSGGAVYGTASTISLFNVTATNNVAGVGPAVYTETSTIQLANSIIANNVSNASLTSEIVGTLSSSGYNMIKTYRSYSGTSDTGNATDIVGQDPLLDLLADNGGAIPTHALLNGSPAIDAGDPAGCRNGATPLTQDQRGQPRALDGDNDATSRCDIGAYEYTFAPGFVLSPVRGLVTTELGGTATFQVRLNAAPTSSVTLPLSSSNPNEGTVSPGQLVFDSNNWGNWQTVSVQGIDDALVDGAVAYSIVTGPAASGDSAFAGLNPIDVAVVNYDNESAAAVVNPVAGITTTEGGTASFISVSLAAAPTADVTVVLTIGDTTEGTFLMPGGIGIPLPGGGMSDGSYIALLFTSSNWQVPHTIGVYPVNDSMIDPDVAYTITAAITSADPAYNGAAMAPIAVTNVNSDTASPPAGGGGGSNPPPAAAGGGGGCTMAPGAHADPLFPLMIIVAMLALWQRRRLSRRC